ncbi:hypothetical protein JMW52_00155 [Clostridioides difficile]|uniref:hypothetical protein n=1 Tax=Clostridioides difficile TaxID=1496 RepID=UPI001AF2AB0E|nr:hypothetical protein [Clostridioides difficile]QQY55060.1 hypothetical protein JMW52_18705 [Clostridioides difficile]QQY55062.1 hypothetical protein JMW52_00155 [Clostridioides difficile]
MEGGTYGYKKYFKKCRCKKKAFGRNLVSALENAKNKQEKEVVLSKKCSEVPKDKIKDIFGRF